MRRLYELILAVFLVCITTVSTLYAQAPGGVTTGLLMWHKADDGTGTPGATTTWADVSGNGRDVTQSNNTAYEPNLILDAVHSADNKEYFFNFNPFYYFDGGDFFYRDAGAIGDYFPASGAGSVYGVMYNEGTAGGYLTPFGWGDDDPNLVRRDDRYSVWRNNGSVIEEDLALTSAGTHIGGMGWQPTGNDGVYLNFNGTVYSNTTTDIGTINDRYFAVGSEGAFLTGAGNERFIGGLPEVFAYSVDHENSAGDEKLRINSYLAIKYGITLQNSAGTGTSDYLNSASTNVWNATAHSGYGNNVFGIARDDASALHQKQSRSANNNQKLIIGNGSALFNTNGANTNDLVDGQFLIVGDNGLKQQLATPMAYTAGANGATNFRFEAIWKVQNTENVGSVTVAWPKGVTNLYLVQSTDETVDASDTFTPMVNEVTINGMIHNTATVTMADGTYFTFAGFAHAPGGVVGGLSYWYRADNGVANTGAGTDVTSWTDMFQGAVSAQLGTNALPKYAEGASDYFNFNPGINFTAATQSLGNTTVQTISELEFDMFMLTKEGVTHSGGNPRVFSSLVDNDLLDGNIHRWDGIGLLADQRSERVNNAFDARYLGNPGGITWSTTIPSIMYHRFTDLTISKGLNGAANGSNGTHSARGYMNGGHAFGDTRFSSNDSDNAGFIGHLGETIIYGAGSLSETERRRVDSYLAIKYGITLGRVETNPYLASDETMIWDGSIATAYNNNIFGVAKDDIGVFEQKVSRSVNAAGSILTLATTNDFTSPNGDASRTGFTNDKTYFLLGDNNATATPLVDLTVAGNDGQRIQRIWLAQRTNTPGALYVEADLSAYGASFAEGNNVYMLVADDADFTTNATQTSGTFNDGKWVFSYNFDDDAALRYITFAEVAVTCTGPDSDGDGIPDMCDLDTDNDGILNADECGERNLIIRGNFTALPPTPGAFSPSAFTAATSNYWTFESTGTGFDAEIVWENITFPFVFGNGIRFQRDGSTQSLTQSISGWHHGGNPQIIISKIAANNSNPLGNSSTLIVSYASVEYARIVTTGGTGNGATITYNNGATSSLTSFAIGTVYNNWVIELPFDAPAAGDLTFRYLAGPHDSDDFALGDIIVNACRDTDGDGIPDLLDLDSDGDGCPDAIEGDGEFDMSALTTASGTIASQAPNQNFGIAVDANGIPTVVGSAGQGIGQSRDETRNDCTDTDGDGYPDWQDADADNDGILNTDECPDLYVVRPVTTASVTVNGTITVGSAQQIVDGEGAGGTGPRPESGSDPLNWYTNISNLPIEFSMDLQAPSIIDHIKLYSPWGIDEWIKEFTVELYDGSNVLLGTENLTAPDQYVGGTILSFSQEYTDVEHIELTIISGQGYNSFNRASVNEIVFLDMQVCDTDGDGIPDYLDLDSDNDGCPDALEGDENVSLEDLNPDGSINTDNTGGVNGNGVPNLVNTGGSADDGGDVGQGIGSAQDALVNTCDTYCVQPGATGTPTEFTQVGISDREGFGAGWPESIPNGFVAIESEDSGFVITRVQQVSDIADPQEGMLVYEIEDQCLKLYNGTTWNCIQRSCNE